MSLIICCGVDGAGKSTVAKLLTEQMCQLGQPTECYREPGGTALGEALRPLLLDKSLAMAAETQTMLFVASRMQLLTELIPKLQAGINIVLDRFAHCTLAYQVYAGNISRHFATGLNAQCMAIVNRAVPGIPIHAFNLYVSPEEATRRLALTGKSADRFESKGEDYRRKIAQGYYELEDPFIATRFGVPPLFRINAEQPLTHVVRDILSEINISRKTLDV